MYLSEFKNLGYFPDDQQNSADRKVHLNRLKKMVYKWSTTFRSINMGVLHEQCGSSGYEHINLIYTSAKKQSCSVCGPINL